MSGPSGFNIHLAPGLHEDYWCDVCLVTHRRTHIAGIDDDMHIVDLGWVDECRARSQGRILVAEHWLDGELNGRWTTETPGVTGPNDLMATNMIDANAGKGWNDDGTHIADGWSYRWHKP